MNKVSRYLFLGILVFVSYTPQAWAVTTSYDVEQMLLNLQQSLPDIANLAIGGAYVMGVAFGVKGLYDLKVYGESRTMMSGSANLKSPLMHLFISMMFIYFPSAFEVVMNTTFGYSSVLAYDQFPSGTSLSMSAIVVLQVIQVMGIFAFVRGWVMLARSSSGQGGGHGLFGRGLLHVVGGVFAMNIVGTCDVIANTFGISF